MKITRRIAAIGGVSLLGSAALTSIARAEFAQWLEGIGEGLEDFWIATDAYIYGYPLVTMEMTRRVMTNVAEPKGTRAPMGQLIRLRQYPDASFRDVTAPNADTLYTTAFFDVGKEPWVLSLPDMNGRYFLMPMLDGWTTVFQAPGKRTTGTGAQTYAITGPGWSGTLPDGVKQYKSPTSLVWLLGRIYCTGTPEDYKAVHALQDEIKLVPLSSYGKPYTPPPGKVDPSIDMKTPVRDQVNKLDAIEYFTLLAELMKTNPPAAADAPALARFAKIGLVPGQDFDKSKFNADFVKRIPQVGFDRIMLQFKINPAVQAHQWLGLHHQDRDLRNRLLNACPCHGDRSWREPSRRMPSIQHRSRMRTAARMMARTNTSCASKKARPRPWKASGRLPCITSNISSSQTRSIAIRSALGKT